MAIASNPNIDATIKYVLNLNSGDCPSIDNLIDYQRMNKGDREIYNKATLKHLSQCKACSEIFCDLKKFDRESH